MTTANGGVETSAVKAARAFIELAEKAAPVKTVIAKSMNTGRKATEDLILSTNRLL